MAWWETMVCIIGGGLVLSFWGWVAISIIRLWVAVRTLEQAQVFYAKGADEQGAVLRRIDAKLDTLTGDVARLFGILEGQNHG